VVNFSNTELPIDGFEFADDDNAVIAWLTVYGQLRFWLFNLTTLRLPLSLPREWGESNAVAYNPSLNTLVLELGTATPCGWTEVGLHANGLADRTVDLPAAACGGPPGAGVSSDGTLFASIEEQKSWITSIWSVSDRQKIQSWQQFIQFSGDLAFFDGSRGLVEALGSEEGINLVTTIDLYRVRNQEIVGQYPLRPVPQVGLDTALDVLGGVLVAIELVGQRFSSQLGSLRAYAYYALPLPVLN